jgi:regulator of replication initiation timing
MDKKEILDFVDGLEYHMQRIHEDISRLRKELEKNERNKHATDTDRIPRIL